MTNPTGPELSAFLAENVCGYERLDADWFDFKDPDRDYDGNAGTFRPHSDANDLREVLAKVPEEKRDAVEARLRVMCHDEAWAARVTWGWFLLTVPPETVCAAIWSVMNYD